jgi:hypothetical protein
VKPVYAHQLLSLTSRINWILSLSGYRILLCTAHNIIHAVHLYCDTRHGVVSLPVVLSFLHVQLVLCMHSHIRATCMHALIKGQLLIHRASYGDFPYLSEQ